MRLLWLHDLGNPLLRRQSAIDFEHSVVGLSPKHSVVVWDASSGSDSRLESTNWDGVFLGPSFLSNRGKLHSKNFEEKFRWVRDRARNLIAIPQDEYSFSGLLDSWLSDWHVDHILTCFPEETEVLYPISTSAGAKFARAFTGYASESLRKKGSERRPGLEGPLVGYRASLPVPAFGRTGWDKIRIGQEFSERYAELGDISLLDISLDRADSIAGAEWLDFLIKCQFTLSSPSGSSMLDPRGEYLRAVSKAVRGRGYRHWEEINLDQFCNLGIPHSFETISPRHIEAALLRVPQIGFSGNYAEVLSAETHMILLHRDFSNFPEVIKLMADPAVAEGTAEAAYQAVADNKGVQLSSFLDLIEELAFEGPLQGLPNLDAPNFEALVEEQRHRNTKRIRNARWQLFASRAVMRLKDWVPWLSDLIIHYQFISRKLNRYAKTNQRARSSPWT